MKILSVETELAPAAIGPYAQAVCAGNLVFVSGQIPIDPSGGKLIEGDIKVQTHCVLKNLKAILLEAGSSLEQVLKVELFLVDMNDFAAVNKVYAEFFTSSKPARQAVGVAALPKGASLEISCIAITE